MWAIKLQPPPEEPIDLTVPSPLAASQGLLSPLAASQGSPRTGVSPDSLPLFRGLEPTVDMWYRWPSQDRATEDTLDMLMSLSRHDVHISNTIEDSPPLSVSGLDMPITIPDSPTSHSIDLDGVVCATPDLGQGGGASGLATDGQGGGSQARPGLTST